MKRNLDLDPILWTMIDLEAKMNAVTGACIVRTAVLEFISRTHQTRIPALFKNEFVVAQYQRLLEIMHQKLDDPDDLKEIARFLKIPGDQLLLELMAHVLVLLDEQRDQLLKSAKKQQKHSLATN